MFTIYRKGKTTFVGRRQVARYSILVIAVAALVYLVVHGLSRHKTDAPKVVTITIAVNVLSQYQAGFAVKMAHDEVGTDLDYSDRSVDEVERILDHLQHRWFFKKNEQWSAWFGAYIGEVLHRQHNAAWTVQKTPDGKTHSAIELPQGWITDPVEQCRKRLESGSDYDVAKYFAQIVRKLPAN